MATRDEESPTGHGRELYDGKEVAAMKDKEEQRAMAWQGLGWFHPNHGEDGNEDGQRIMMRRWLEWGW